jgi:hypothetical protein
MVHLILLCHCTRFHTGQVASADLKYCTFRIGQMLFQKTMQVGVAVTFACARCNMLHTFVAPSHAIIQLEANWVVIK